MTLNSGLREGGKGPAAAFAQPEAPGGPGARTCEGGYQAGAGCALKNAEWVVFRPKARTRRPNALAYRKS